MVILCIYKNDFYKFLTGLFYVFSSATLSRNTDNKINLDSYVVIENVPDNTDSTITESIQPEVHLTENKIENTTLYALESTKENHLPYVRFNNCEINNIPNGKSNGVYTSDSISESNSSDSISFRKLILTPIKENEVKLSNGYEDLI